MTEFEYEPMPSLKVYRERVWGEMQMQTHLLKQMSGSVKDHELRVTKIEGEVIKAKVVGATLAGLATLSGLVLSFKESIIKAFH